jgi:hypothetical protein
MTRASPQVRGVRQRPTIESIVALSLSFLAHYLSLSRCCCCRRRPLWCERGLVVVVVVVVVVVMRRVHKNKEPTNHGGGPADVMDRGERKEESSTTRRTTHERQWLSSPAQCHLALLLHHRRYHRSASAIRSWFAIVTFLARMNKPRRPN